MFGRKNKHPEAPAVAKPAPAKSTVSKPIAAESSSETPKAGSAPIAVRDRAAGGGQAKGKLAYETRRAEKNGMGLEKWMAEKDRRARAEREAIAQTRRKSDTERQNQVAQPGLLRRLLDRAHRPL